MRQLVAQLTGGLGNQMFQYAFGRALSSQHGAPLIVDTWSGFWTDRLYRRTYGLGELPIRVEEAGFRSKSAHQTLAWMAATRLPTYPGNQKWVTTPFRNITLIREIEHRANIELLEQPLHGKCWLFGYWQSPIYFDSISDELIAELSPPAPVNPHLRNLGYKMRDSNSIAVGTRLYEESPDPAFHARDRDQKTVQQWQTAVEDIVERNRESEIFVFSTQKSELHNHINWPSRVRFITNDLGYGLPLDKLWLLSQCQHHLFNNSSFYWWGAWLSQKNYPTDRQVVVASNNFLNVDCLPAWWTVF